MTKVMKIDGKTIKNATKPVTIHITGKDATKGATKAPTSCAAALACVREIPKCTEARIHISTAYLKIGGQWVRYKTSQPLRTEIIGFDRGAKFTPGEYRLTPVSASHRAGYGKRQGSNKDKKKTGKKRAKYHVTTGVRAFADYK